MSENVLVTSIDASVMTMRINRPEHENRLNLAVLKSLDAALRQADADPDIRAVVLTGTGDTFCCGGDVDEFAAGDAAAYQEFGRHFAGVHLAIVNLRKPVLAAVNGHVRAGGMSLLSVCDVAVARAAVRMAMPEIEAGLWPMMAMVSLNRVLSRKRAMALYYFGDSFDVRQAVEWGLVNWVVADDEFDQAVRMRARQLASLPRRAVEMGRTAFAEIADQTYAAGFNLTADRLVEMLTDPEIVQALAQRKAKP